MLSVQSVALETGKILVDLRTLEVMGQSQSSIPSQYLDLLPLTRTVGGFANACGIL